MKIKCNFYFIVKISYTNELFIIKKYLFKV